MVISIISFFILVVVYLLIFILLNKVSRIEDNLNLVIKELNEKL